jgi:hypothetical protein
MINRSREKNLQIDKDYFTVKYLMERISINPYCECCGKRFDISFKSDRKYNDDSPSMDRVNTNLGYVKENVAILCWCCNKHKQDSTPEQLRQIADFIEDWVKKPNAYEDIFTMPDVEIVKQLVGSKL